MHAKVRVHVVNDIQSATSDAVFDQAQGGADDGQPIPAAPEAGPSTANGSYRSLGINLIILFWVARFLTLMIVTWIHSPERIEYYLYPRLILLVVAIALSIGIFAAQTALKDRSMRLRALAAVLLAIVGSAIHAVINDYAYIWVGPPGRADGMPGGISYWTIMLLDPLFIYVALSAMILAIVYGNDIREREDQIHALRALAQTAQLRALRNQLNPHFLFNTLNSIASLISRSRQQEAERMTESLADFLRETLTLDPQRQITLAEEIELQGLYLTIERARFPDRLRVRVDIPDKLKDALVPSLITQPLVENSIKYAVARSSEPVELEVLARSDRGRLELVIRDNGGNADAPAPKGERVGLANVSERLRLHYGAAADFEAAPRSEGGFANRIRIPLRFAVWNSTG